MTSDPAPSDLSHAHECRFHDADARTCEECAEELEDYFMWLDAGESRYCDE